MSRATLVTLTVVLAACGARRPATSAWQLSAPIPLRDVASVDADALVMIEADLPSLPPAAAQPRRVLAFGTGPRLPEGIDALVIADDGAAAAIDLALLHSHGIAIPPRLPLGCRVLTRANAAAGGSARPFAGDFALQMLRGQHPEVLTTTPSIDVVFTIGCVRCGDDPSAQAVEQAVIAAARRFPQLALRQLPAAASEADLGVQADTLVRAGARAILVVLPTTAAPSLAAMRAVAATQKLAVIALDPTLRCEHADSVIGSDPATCGRALGDTLRALLPLGGTVVPVRAAGHDDALAAQRLQGLAAALGAPAPK